MPGRYHRGGTPHLQLLDGFTDKEMCLLFMYTTGALGINTKNSAHFIIMLCLTQSYVRIMEIPEAYDCRVYVFSL